MNIKDVVARRLKYYQIKPETLYGVIGDLATGTVEVPNVTSTIYVTLHSGVVLNNVRNTRVPNIFGLEVKIGFDPYDMPYTLQVLKAKDNYYGQIDNPSVGINNHHVQHEWPHGDSVFTAGQLFLPSLYMPVAGTKTVNIYPGTYKVTTGWKYFTAVENVDLTASIASITSGKGRLSVIVVDKDGSFAVRNGSLVTETASPFLSAYAKLTYTDLPALTIGDTPICAVKLYYGQLEFYCNGQRNDFIDMRFLNPDTGNAGGIATGFENRTLSTITLSTRTLTVAPTVTSFNIYSSGKVITKTTGATCATTIPNTVGLHYIYFDTNGTLQNSMSEWDFLSANVPVCTIFWNGSAGAVGEERHSYCQNQMWHQWAHETIGTRYESGLGQTYPTTVVDGKAQIETGIIFDEDIEITTGQQLVIRNFYETGAGVWTFANGTNNAGNDRPYIWNGGSSKLQYPKSDDSYTLTDCAADKYLTVWVFASTDTARPIYIITEAKTAPYDTLVLARAAMQPVIKGLLPPEMKLIYSWIFTGDGEYQEGVDYRTAATAPDGRTPTMAAVGVSFVPTGAVGATNVQSAIGEVDSEKAAGPASAIDGHLAVFDGITGKVLKDGGAPAGGGDVTGPEGATTGHQAVFADETGKVIEDGGPAGGGGHTIQDDSTPMTARANLNFTGTPVTVTDDVGNDATIIDVSATVSPGAKVYAYNNFN